MTPITKNEDDPVSKSSSPPSSRKDFIYAYAQMAPYLRPESSRLAGRKRAPTATTVEIDEWEGFKRHRFTLDAYQPLKPRTIILNFSHTSSPRLNHQTIHRSSINSSDSSRSDDMIISDPASLGGNRRKRGSKDRGPVIASRDMLHKKDSVAPKCRRARQHNGASLSSCGSSSPPASVPPSPAAVTPATSPSSPRRSSRGEVCIKGFTISPKYAFDTLDIDSDDQDYYPAEWLPMADHLDQVSVDITWKGQPLSLDERDLYLSRLHPSERRIVSHLRLTPVQYVRCKRAIIMAAREFSKHAIEFRRSDAQKVCRIDVNKSSKLWGIFEAYGWLHPQS
ncbi:hypothetical protein BX666DRAFT_2030472 [Dichotomocladium elegans]|nr:hypothetical protein BX666DRAFT_2030472 [Dichotomocladium elegans]